MLQSIRRVTKMLKIGGLREESAAPTCAERPAPMSPAARRAALEEKWLRESEHCCHAGAADRFERPGNISVVYREVRVEIVCGPGGCDDRDRFELV